MSAIQMGELIDLVQAGKVTGGLPPFPDLR